MGRHIASCLAGRNHAIALCRLLIPTADCPRDPLGTNIIAGRGMNDRPTGDMGSGERHLVRVRMVGQRRAAATARSMSTESPSATDASFSPVEGLKLSKVLPEADNSHLPSISIRFGLPSRNGCTSVMIFIGVVSLQKTDSFSASARHGGQVRRTRRYQGQCEYLRETCHRRQNTPRGLKLRCITYRLG